MTRPVVLGLVFVLVTASGLGLLFGLRVAGLDESALIERAGRAHVAAGGRPQDCVARPGTGRVRVVVTCTDGESASVFAFDRWGFSVDPAPAPGT